VPVGLDAIVPERSWLNIRTELTSKEETQRVHREEITLDDICELVGTAMRHRVDVKAVVDHHFPSHDSLIDWRDADNPFAAAVLENRDDLSYALIEAALSRGGRRVDGNDGLLEFDDQVDAERFRDWCRFE
jgi:hypothetical protein